MEVISLKTSDIEGEFDFISSLISLNNYDIKDKKEIEKISKLNIFDNNFSGKFCDTEMNILSILYHEITHFLDTTTTTWGIEFTGRKYLFADKVSELSTETFMLNTSEVMMHNDLLEVYDDNIDLLKLDMEHELNYSKVFGSYITISFKEDNEIKVKSSVNMLSVLEAHAYVVEILVRIKYIESTQRTEKPYMDELEKEIEQFLNDVNFIEYNMIIVLAKKHFDYLNTKELFGFLNVFIVFILDIGSADMAQLVAILKYSYKDEEIGNGISLDMQRGMSRHSLAFKLIISIHYFMLDNKDLIPKLKKDPLEIIKYYITKGLGLKNILCFSEDFNEYICLLSELESIQHISKNEILETIVHNRTNIDTIYKIRNISEYKLLDIFLNDKTIVSMPNRVNTNINKYFNSCMKGVAYLFNDAVKKHIHPSDIPSGYKTIIVKDN